LPSEVEVTRNHDLLRLITLGGYVSGIIFAVAGVIFVYLGATGQTEFSFFGQQFKSTNAGIAALFLAASLIILLIRRTLGSFDNLVKIESSTTTATKAKGRLEISDIQRVCGKIDKNCCTLDFRVINTGGSEVILNKLLLRAKEAYHMKALGFKKLSKVYDLDIQAVREPGDEVSCSISQVVKPGKVDRFGVTLSASELGHDARAWLFLPVLLTSAGRVQGPEVEVCLPGLGNFSDIKRFSQRTGREKVGRFLS